MAVSPFREGSSFPGERRLQIEAAGMSFSARAAGPADGEPVILLHGFPQSSWQWRSQLQALGSAGYWAVAPDQRGYCSGARPGEIGDYGIDELCGDVLAMADHLGAQRFHLVGHDWGAAVAWVVASRHPRRLGSLCAVSVPHPRAFFTAIQEDHDQQRRSSYMDFFRRGDAEQLLLERGGARLRAVLEEVDPDDVHLSRLQQPGAMTAALNWYRAMDEGQLAATGKIDVSTLYVWGARDAYVGRTAAEATAPLVRARYRFEVLEDIGHWIPELAAAALNDLLLAHLRAFSLR
jgi:pimeloyl-ACP methyl ester carboxylesterase